VRRRRFAVTVVATAVAVLGAVVVGRPGRAASAAPAPSLHLQTPVLSVRRVPDLLARTIGQLRLAPVLDKALADPSLGPATNNSCLLVQQGTVQLFSHRPTSPMIPGSTLKLLTATAALDKLGPQTPLVSGVRADHPATAGVVNGNVYLVGGGDPLLRTADYVAGLHYKELLYTHLEDLAQAVRAAGVTHVTGGVIGDESRFDSQRYVPTWKPGYASAGDVGPLSALQVNDGFQAVKPKAVPAANPPAQAAATFTALLKAHGVAVDAGPSAGQAPTGAAELTSLKSAPLADVLAEVLRQSDNNGAELITKELGRQFGGGPTTAAGVAVIRADLASAGLPVDQLTLVDGSGLDRADRVSCQLLLAALQRGGPSGPLGNGLPIAGQTGTLQDRLGKTSAAGRLHAKTGTLDAVSGLAGFVVPPPAVPGAAQVPSITFACLFNGNPSRASAQAVEDRIGALLAQFPDAPPVDSLAALPAVP
jgi:D-alanyl-D-alanine carboxypeptidase/D-alanyl-D-alanine-endopeptidase (penicillin-binding protein 4)